MIEYKGLILRGSALRLILLFTNIAVALYMMPFIIHTIGDRWYGMWTLVGTFMGYYGYLDFGLSIATQRFIAGAIGRKDSDEINKLFTTALAVLIVFGFAAVGVTLLVALFAPAFFTDAAEISVFRVVVLILGINVALTFLMAPINGLMTGHLRYDIATYIELAKLAARTGLILYFIGAGYSIIALAAITLLTDVGGNLLKIVFARRIFSELGVGRRFYTRARLRELFGYGARSFVNQIADLLRFQIDHLVIAAFITLSAVTLFNIAGQLVYYFRMLIGTLMSVLIPVFARFQAAKDSEAVYKTYYFVSKISAIVAILAGGAAIIFGKEFIHLWMGQEYSNAYALVVILIVPSILYATQQPAISLIYGLGAVGTLARVSIIEAVANVALSLILVVPYGLTGVALGTGIPLTFFSLFLLLFSNRLVNGRLLDYMRQILPVFLVGVLLQVGAWLIVDRTGIDGYADIVWLFLALYPAQFVLMMILMFNASELRLIKDTGLRALGLAR